MKILIAPSGFKESIGASEVADAITRGIRRALPAAYIQSLPLVDGGEGFTEELVKATSGSLHKLNVTGPVGKKIPSYFGFLGGENKKTAVVEMAAAAGLRLVPKELRNPLSTSTGGVGELIKAALDMGAERILLGCGDSGTNDGGAGAAQALGVKLLNAAGKPIGPGGRCLKDLVKVDISQRDPRLNDVSIDVACNWHNLLCGPKGVARVFGPQKGASDSEVIELEEALENYANIIESQLDTNVHNMNGGGASGGLGAGAYALLGAKLHPRFDIVTEYLNLDAALATADLVFTAEGGIDFQTPHGKIPSEVARRAKRLGLPVIAIVGTVGADANDNFEYGIDAFISVVNRPMNLEMAMETATELVAACAENVMRTIIVGTTLVQRRALKSI